MIKVIFLGIVQGLTEFLPVSSSAHLVFTEKIFGSVDNNIAFFVVLHLGTVAALIVFFFKEIIRLFKDIKLILLILVATVITGAIGIFGKDYFESLFSSTSATAWQLVINGVMLIVANNFLTGTRKAVNLFDSIIFALAQAISIVPGISRSGATISSMLFRKVEKETAFNFSFLASIPVILGAALLEIKDIDKGFKADTANFAVGFLVSFIFGIIALSFVKLMLKKAKLHYFGYYCIIVGILTLIFLR